MSHNGPSTSSAQGAARDNQPSDDQAPTPWVPLLPLPAASNQTPERSQTPTAQVEQGQAHHTSGSCSVDAHKNIEAARIAHNEKAHRQFISAIHLCHVTLFAVDRQRAVTMLQGAMVHGSHSMRYIGENVYNVFDRLNSTLREGPFPPFLEPIESMLSDSEPPSTRDYEIGAFPGVSRSE